MRHTIDPSRQHESGSVSTEFALLAVFILIPFLACVADLGQAIHAQYVLSRAAREGAFSAAQGQDPAQAVARYLSAAGLSAAKARITAAGQNLPAGSDVSVRIDYDASSTPFIPWDSLTDGLCSLAATAYTRHR